MPIEKKSIHWIKANKRGESKRASKKKKTFAENSQIIEPLIAKPISLKNLLAYNA